MAARLSALALAAASLAACGSVSGGSDTAGGGSEAPSGSDGSPLLVLAELPPVGGDGPAEFGSPLLRVRDVRLGPNASPPLDTDPDDRPRWFVTSDGWLLAPDDRGDGDAAVVVPAWRLTAAQLDALRAALDAADLFTPPGAQEQPERDVEGVEIAAEDVARERPLAVHRFAADAADLPRDVLKVLADAARADAVGYRPRRFRVVVEDLVGGADGRAVPWPVPAVPLATARRCTVVVDEAATDLARALEVEPDHLADGRGRWHDGEETFTVAVRPLLPGEGGCPDAPR